MDYSLQRKLGNSTLHALNVRCPACYVMPGQNCKYVPKQPRLVRAERFPHKVRIEFVDHVIQCLKRSVRHSDDLTKQDVETWNSLAGIGYRAFSLDQLKSSYGELYYNAFTRRDLVSIERIQQVEMAILKHKLKGNS